jgi:hypothetical protein
MKPPEGRSADGPVDGRGATERPDGRCGRDGRRAKDGPLGFLRRTAPTPLWPVDESVGRWNCPAEVP